MTDDFPSTLVHYGFDVRLCRIIDNTILPARLSVKAQVIVLEEAEDKEVDFAMAKIQYWIANCMTQCVAFAVTNEDAVGIMIDENGTPRTGNRLMLTPDEPSDEHLAILLQAKLTALGGNALVIGDVEVASDNTTGLTFTYLGEEDVLPPMENWVGTRNWFSEPWWARDDGSMLDTQPAEDADLTQHPTWAIKFDFLAPTADVPEAVVVPGKFRPHVIDGDKDKK